MANNNLANKEAGKALATMLKDNIVLRELDVSSNHYGTVNGADGSGFAQELAVGLDANGTLMDLDISNNGIGALVLREGWECDKSASSWNSNEWIYNHADGREQKEEPTKKPAGAIAIANAIRVCQGFCCWSQRQRGIGVCQPPQ